MDLLKQAIEAGKRRDYPRSIKLLTQLVNESEDNWSAYIYLGRAYHAAGEYSKAIQSFLNVPPEKEPAVDFFLGRSYLNAEIYDGAAFHFQRLYRTGNYPLQLYPYMGMALYKLKRYSLSHQYFEKAVVHFPEDKRIFSMYRQNLYILAIKLVRQEKYNDALEIFLFLEKSGMEHISILLFCGFIFEENAENIRALGYYQRALETAPEDTAIKIRVIDCLFKCGEVEKAEVMLSGINRDAEHYIDKRNLNKFLAEFYYERKEYGRAIRYAVRDLKIYGHTVDVHLLLGVAYRETEQLEIALNHFDRVLDLEKNNLNALWGKLTVYWLLEDWNSCDGILKRIHRLYPGDEIYEYYNPLVMVKLEMAPEATIEELRELMQKNQEDPYLMLILGSEYIRAGNAWLAYQILKKVTAFDNYRKDALISLIALSGLLGKTDEQIVLYQKYLKIAGDDDRTRYEFIQLLIRLDKYKEAIPHIEAIIPIPEYHKRLLPLLAFLKRETGAWAESGVLYKQLLRNDPVNPGYLQNLVFCMMKLKKKDTALELMQKALKFMKFDADLYLILGVLYFKNSDNEQAMKAFRECMDKYPKDWRIYFNISRIYEKQGLHQYARKYKKMSEQYETAAK